MRRIMAWMAAGTALLLAPGVPAPLAAQCMGCVSSSACGPSSTRGNCSAECVGTVCACSDTQCRSGVTVAPAGMELPARFAVGGDAEQAPGELLGVLVRECDGRTELLVYSADGTRLIESRLLTPPSTPPARLAHAEPGDG